MAKPRRPVRLLSTLLAIALVIGGTAAVLSGDVALASSGGCQSGTTVSETAATGFTFICRGYSDVPTNSTLTIDFFDSDTTSAHTFTLIDRPNVSIPDPSSVSPGKLGQIVHDYGVLVNLTATIKDPTNTTTMAPVKWPAWYEFVCMESGHFQSGMWGYIAFGEILPSNLSLATGSPGPGLALFIIVGTVVSLTVLAVVLGFVVGRRQGSEHEMPPERLGYPEPSEPRTPPAPLPPKPPA